ncbi:3-phosphoshikimate 1-carboxyvinyltransferase [Denitrobaculum tricleocarpae]|uniref:3-phosphoshikimate 1-carboxyvinyltransferase n=1 Tax=Denitrobaculum tricleocarpae TaxID=2591009 RepID=A0A545TG49_9PROT|nr:3-phosphoshikimate 1-carboxyvinyltransferase [Denitrobaculum tricleocarpae]TQV76210.1 3-phosphoshikimate 1-carboxyvinyltransferase [Denitrobaculum tricleocarpae]
MTVKPLTATASGPLTGDVRVPGDKSISHRALMLSAIAVGESRVEGLLEGEDVLCTAAAMRALGAEIERDDNGVWHIWGRGVGGLQEPANVLDMGNSGTAARLLLGLLATHPLTATMTGDESLRGRPMGRVTRPLGEMGAAFTGRSDLSGKGRDLLPLTIQGSDSPIPITYRLPVASAQVKSAVLLAGLNTPGETTVIEPAHTRDHSELMLRHFGARIKVEETSEGRATTLTGQPELTGRYITVPADPSSAAFPSVAALLSPGSEITLRAVGMNPHRIGLFITLREMGANIEFTNEREEGGEPVADLIVRAGPLQGIEVPAERAPSMIDEYPVLAMAAACAEGTTVMRGLAELRVKECDRLAATARGLEACGVKVEEGEDSLIVHGVGAAAGYRPEGGGTVATHFDHRIAMSFLVLGLVSKAPVTVDDATAIDTSFPDFQRLMTGLGAHVFARNAPVPSGA